MEGSNGGLAAALAAFDDALAAAGDAENRAWWEAYLRGAIPFVGVPTAELRALLHAWRREHALDAAPPEEQLAAALALFEGAVAERKLAGTLYLQRYLLDALPWARIVDGCADLFDRGRIADWNTCDWLCVRVLGPLLRREGPPAATALLAWTREPYLWRARAGLVPFVAVADDDAFDAPLLEGCARLIGREERFAKTAVGWVLRERARHDPAPTVRFVEAYAVQFSLESVRNAAKGLEASERERLVALVKGAEPRKETP